MARQEVDFQAIPKIEVCVISCCHDMSYPNRRAHQKFIVSIVINNHYQTKAENNTSHAPMFIITLTWTYFIFKSIF